MKKGIYYYVLEYIIVEVPVITDFILSLIWNREEIKYNY